jgi:hypothetical protein
MGILMKHIFDRPIPVGLFAIVIVLACVLFVVSFSRQGEHFKQMEEFMAKGDRFTGQDGREMTERIDQLEKRVILLEANTGH